MILDINEKDKVVGEIYKITNLITGKCYVGQTRSHRLNKNKYRPFGYMGRLKDHINEANTNKENQSRYLNASILKYGKDNFTCEKLLDCEINCLDDYEKQYITQYNTLYPNGYNLTRGGKGERSSSSINKIDFGDYSSIKSIQPRKGFKRSDETKRLISTRIKDATSSIERRTKMMKTVQNQHLQNKFEKFRNIKLDFNNIDQYIHVINHNDSQYIRFGINKKTSVRFVGKYQTIAELKERAMTFARDLIKWQCDQIAGSSLEPLLPLTSGNSCEELG
jgi:group I intron endonuclease